MDFSRARMRYGSNASFSSGAGGSGPQIVKTYGRFKQRMISRDAKGAQEFARVASSRPILADLLDSDSSDSDFEAVVAKAKSTPPSSQTMNSDPTAQKETVASDSSSTAGSQPKQKLETESESGSKPKSKPRPRQKSKQKTAATSKASTETKVKANAKEKASSSSSSNSKSRSRTKPKSKAKESTRESSSISAPAADEVPKTKIAYFPTEIPAEILSISKPPGSNMQDAEPEIETVTTAATTAAAKAAPLDAENSVKEKVADLQSEHAPRASIRSSSKSRPASSKPKEEKPSSKSKSKPKAKAKAKARAKQQPKARAEAKTDFKEKSESPSQPKPGLSVSSNNAESVDADKMDADSAAMDKAPTLASLPTPISSAQSLPDSRSSSMVVDSPQTAAEPSVEPAPRIPTAAPLASLVAETNLDCMQVDEPEPASDIGQFIDGATATSDGIRVDSLVAEPNKASALAPAYASDMTSAMPSPISSGRVAKRRTARPRRPTLARKKSSADALDDLTLARHISDPNRMSIDHRESQDLATAIGADAESNSDALRRFKLENRQTEAAAADIGGAAVAPPPFSGLKRKSPEAESQASVMQTDTLFAKMAEDENSGSAPNPELAFESAEQTKFDIEHAPELAADSVAEVKAGAAVDADAIEDLEPDEVSDDEGAPRRQLMGTRTIRFKAPRDARVQIFELDEDDDQQMEQSQSNELTQSESNRMDTDVIPDPNEPLPVHFQALASPQTGQAHSSTTPRKKNLSRLAGASSADAPHSPSRVTTPHRVVYSPVNPKTVINPHRNGAHGLANGNDSVSDTPAKAPRFSLGQATDGGKDLGKDKDAYRARLSSIGGSRVTTGRMSTAGEIEPEFEETRVPFLPARRYVQKTHILAACGQTAPIDWVSGGLQACGVLLPELDPSTHTEEEMGEVESRSGLCKIGEATYSEVFSAQWRYVPRTRYDRFNSKKGMVKGERLMQVALKIIPFGNTGVKSGTGEPQTTLRDLYQEIGATLALSRLSERERAKLQEARLQLKVPLSPKERELGANFVKAFRVCICQGPLPAPLLRAWDRWKVEYPALCENVRPDYYPKNQLFAVFVLEMGGETLENAAVSTWKEARSILRQLALSMALAERNNRFEHRDLHWGNIMVTRSNSQLTFLYQLPPSETRQKSTLLSIPSYKVRCTIIDYTLSRLHVDNDANDAVGTKPANYDPTNNVFYVALKDEALFCGEGDIQYDVYRQMRECSKKKWDGFHPKTNVLWLAYVLHKIIKTKSPSICDDLMAFAESKLGAAVAGAPAEIKRAASQELIRRWISEFEQSESCTQALKCALLDLYKH